MGKKKITDSPRASIQTEAVWEIQKRIYCTNAFSLIMFLLAEHFDKIETGLSSTETTKLKIINKYIYYLYKLVAVLLL